MIHQQLNSRAVGARVCVTEDAAIPPLFRARARVAQKEEKNYAHLSPNRSGSRLTFDFASAGVPRQVLRNSRNLRQAELQKSAAAGKRKRERKINARVRRRNTLNVGH